MKRIAFILLVLLVAVSSYAHPMGNGVITVDAAPHELRSMRVTLKGHEPSVFNVVGDKAGKIDCKVYDHASVLVASDPGNGDRCHIELSPKATGEFRLVVHNDSENVDHYVVTVD